jgi:hypothetical protein
VENSLLNHNITDFKLSPLFIVNLHPAFGYWNRVQVFCAVDVSEEYTTSIIRAEVKCVGK